MRSVQHRVIMSLPVPGKPHTIRRFQKYISPSTKAIRLSHILGHDHIYSILHSGRAPKYVSFPPIHQQLPHFLRSNVVSDLMQFTHLSHATQPATILWTDMSPIKKKYFGQNTSPHTPQKQVQTQQTFTIPNPSPRFALRIILLHTLQIICTFHHIIACLILLPKIVQFLPCPIVQEIRSLHTMF